MKKERKAFLISIGITLAAGVVSGLLSMVRKADYPALIKPPLSPPAWLFPLVWTILYILMGAACALVVLTTAPPDEKRSAIALYAAQLFFNCIWSFLFFTFRQYLLAFFWLLALWLLIYLTLHHFLKLNKKAGLLILPYLAWVSFAGYLNFGIFLLN